MSTLAERLAKLIDDGERFASQRHLEPCLIGVPLPSDNFTETVVTIPIHSRLNEPEDSQRRVLKPPSFRNQIRFRFFGDGKVKPYNLNLDWFEDLRTSLVLNGERFPYHVFVWTPFLPESTRFDWSRWAELAKKAAPILHSEPKSDYRKIRSYTKTFLAFVFQSVLGTEFVKQQNGYQNISDLWGATLFALTSPQEVNGGRIQFSLDDRDDQIQIPASADKFLENWCKQLTEQGKAILQFMWSRMDQGVPYTELLRVPSAFRDADPDEPKSTIKKACRRIEERQPTPSKYRFSLAGGVVRLLQIR